MTVVPTNAADFGRVAKGLSQNPLGIIALFIVLVYGFAALVIIFATGLSASERLPLVWFLVAFPCAVLGVFAWLVSRHSAKLYSPGDFKEEANWVDVQMRAAVSLGAATTQNAQDRTTLDVDQIVAAIKTATNGSNTDGSPRRRHILWVDDRGEAGNAFARRAFESLGHYCVLTTSTQDALLKLEQLRFDAIISDMRRPEGEDAGHRLLREVRARGLDIPFFIHTGQNTPDLQSTTKVLGGQGHTGSSLELFEMVVRALNAT